MVARSCNFPSNICLKCPDLLSLLSPHPLTDRTGLHSPALRWVRMLLRQRNHRQCCECAARREPEGSCGKRDRVGNLRGSIETHKVWVKLAHVNRPMVTRRKTYDLRRRMAGSNGGQMDRT